MRGRVRPALLLALAALASLGLAALPVASAGAAYDPVGSGTTKLSFEKSFLAFLKANDVKLAANAPAKLKAGTLTLPVSGGEMDPTIGKGTIEQEGALVFKSARKSVPLKALTIKTKHSPLIAKVGGSQLKVATAAKLTAKREGFGTAFSASKLKLTAKVAERLNKKLRPKEPFKAGQQIGATQSKTQPSTVTVLPQDRTSIVLNAETVAKLNSLFVAVNPISPAERPGPFTFPIGLNGQIAPDASTGILPTNGSIELLQLGGGQIFWHELWFDLGAKATLAEVNVQPSPPYPGKLGQVPILDFRADAVSSNPQARTITVSSASLTFQAQTAASFNQAFAEGKEVFKAGDPLGTLSFTAQAQ